MLILDDSTSAVDTHTDALIQKGLSQYMPDTTKIIIAQRISSVQNADKILVFDNGRIIAQGTHDKLLKSCDIYREVYESQQKEETTMSKPMPMHGGPKGMPGGPGMQPRKLDKKTLKRLLSYLKIIRAR